jgi:hypothetical protein
MSLVTPFSSNGWTIPLMKEAVLALEKVWQETTCKTCCSERMMERPNFVIKTMPNKEEATVVKKNQIKNFVLRNKIPKIPHFCKDERKPVWAIRQSSSGNKRSKPKRLAYYITHNRGVIRLALHKKAGAS